MDQDGGTEAGARTHHDGGGLSSLAGREFPCARKPHKGLRPVRYQDFESESDGFKVVEQDQFFHSEGIACFLGSKGMGEVRQPGLIAVRSERAGEVETGAVHSGLEMPAFLAQESAQKLRNVRNPAGAERLVTDRLEPVLSHGCEECDTRVSPTDIRDENMTFHSSHSPIPQAGTEAL